jgi:type III restriction enzyme
MPPKSKVYGLPHLPLVEALKEEVEGWARQGYSSGATATTQELLHHWFDRDDDGEVFHHCQRRAIETIIYCHEVLKEPDIASLYQRLAAELWEKSDSVQKEARETPFPKYCLKMATGSGKTWVLQALMVWQYFNVYFERDEEKRKRYSSRFLIATPGHEVQNRLLDALKGKRKGGSRDPSTADLKKELFIPDEWRKYFHLQILEPDDAKANASPPEGAFVLLCNWQKFTIRDREGSLWKKYTGESDEDVPRGVVLADFLTEYPDLIVMNDEAHHVHGKKTGRGKKGEESDLVWREFMTHLHAELKTKHEKNMGLFMQVDYSATPFWGSGDEREYFIHIVYDYDLKQAMHDMLVKQVFLEERSGVHYGDLNFRAERDAPSGGHRRGEVIALSQDQKMLMDIGRRKLEQLSAEFREKEIGRKPVMMVLCEDIRAAELATEHFMTLSDERGERYDETKVLAYYSGMKGEQAAEERLDKIDDNDDPLKVVIYVLKLREGFDKKNICITVVLRASEADLLLEQIVGRGLRLMFPARDCPEFADIKTEAYKAIRERREPQSSLDFLFVVEHPKFREFYENLRRDGYAVGSGDSSSVTAAGDSIPVEAHPDLVRQFDVAWPVQIYEPQELPKQWQIDIMALPSYGTDFEQLKDLVSKESITERHLGSGVKTRTWKMENKHFNYGYFLEAMAGAIAYEGREHRLTARKAEIASIADDYTSKKLFEREIDFNDRENALVLNYIYVWDHVFSTIGKAIRKLVVDAQFQVAGQWRKLSNLSRIHVRKAYAIRTTRCIYPQMSYPSWGGGLEKKFIEEILEPSVEVTAWCKLLGRKHELAIRYRDEHHVPHSYYPDFLVKTKDSLYVVETKSDERYEQDPDVQNKAVAAKAWCERSGKVPPPMEQPSKWEYLLLTETLLKHSLSDSFNSLVARGIDFRERLISKKTGKLF